MDKIKVIDKCIKCLKCNQISLILRQQQELVKRQQEERKYLDNLMTKEIIKIIKVNQVK